MALRAVIFDVDGVLINSMPSNIAGINHALKLHGLSLDDFAGDHQASSIMHIVEQANIEHGVRIDYDEFLAEIGPVIDASIARVEQDPELVVFLDTLKNQVIARAIGSSATLHGVTRNLKHMGIADYFDVLVTAEDVTHHKPAPDIYLEVIKRLGIEPTEAVVIEDAPGGVLAAQAAGIATIGFGKYNTVPNQPIGADQHITDWPQLTVQTLKSLVNNLAKEA